MDQARTNIRAALATAQSPAVLCSFGKDSLLVLALAREVVPHIPVIWFRTDGDESFARQIIRDWHLTALSPSPVRQPYLLAQNDEVAMISEYSFGGQLLPVVQDLAPGTACSRLPVPTSPVLFYPFDVLLVGWKDTDTHWAKGDTPLRSDGFMAGRATVRAPIRHMTDEQVRAAINQLGLPYREMDDQVSLCTACMTAKATEVYCPELGHNIPRHQWEQDKSLTAFQQFYQLGGPANG